MARRIILVGCGRKKLDRPACARDLYTSPLFQLSRRWAELQPAWWGVLSALHGVVGPEIELDPYDLSVGDLSPDRARRWAHAAIEELRGPLWRCDRDAQLVLLAGARYVLPLRRALPTTWRLELPLAGMGIGRRLGWLRAEVARLEADNAVRRRAQLSREARVRRLERAR